MVYKLKIMASLASVYGKGINCPPLKDKVMVSHQSVGVVAELSK
jgi:hypothetical protein